MPTKSGTNQVQHPLLKNIDLKTKQLFILVRHRGCTFCRESLTALSKAKHKLLGSGLSLNVVHMGDDNSSKLMAKDFDLPEVNFIADPNRELYQLFGARKGSLREVLGPKVFAKGIFGGSLLKYGVGKLEGDGFQLGGVYLANNQQVQCLHRPEDASDIEDWDQILKALS